MKQYGVWLVVFFLFHLDLLAFATLKKFSSHSQLWKPTASLWVEFEVFFHSLPVSSRAQMAWWEALVYCSKKKKKAIFSIFQHIRIWNIQKNYCFSAPLQYFHHYLRQWLKNAIRLHIFNECESNILRYHNQCQANQENICGLRVCVYVLSKD